MLTYHAVEPGHGAVFVDPGLFAEHLDVIVATGARVTTVSELAAALRAGSLEDRTVAITFDDGVASVARVAAPLLHERNLRATVFCVAGRLGARSDWQSARPEAPTFELATAAELADLTERGWEIGCHGMTHAPLISHEAQAVHHEVVDAHRLLEDVVGVPVRSFAYPYGALPSVCAERAVRATYESACTTHLGLASGSTDVYSIPRVDAYYVRRTRDLRRVLEGRLGVLPVRRLVGSARRVFRKDYAVSERLQ